MGQGGQQEQKGTDLHGHFFGTLPSIGTSLGPKAPLLDILVPSFSIFHRIIQIALSSNDISFI